VLSSEPVGKRLCGFVVVLFSVLSVAALTMWNAEDMHAITGDEPHYLVIADGLLPTFELEQTGPYTREFRNRTIVEAGLAPRDAVPGPGNTHAEQGPRGLFNVHNIGLPIVLSVPYLLAGETGARLAMIAIGAAIVLLMCRIVALTSLSPRAQLFTVLPFAVGLPVVTGATQIYPDLPAGALCLLGLLFLLRPARPERRWDGVPTAVALAFLPWLHIRFGLPMVLILAAITWARRQDRTRALALRWWLPAVMSVMLLATYNTYAFGNPTGPYASGDVMLNRIAVMQFVGLLLDQNQGILVQQPLHLVGVYFLFRELRKRPVLVLAAVGTSLSILVPNATHWNLYGGWSFSGRFGWAASSALTALTLVGLAGLYRSNRRAWALAVGLGLAVQARHLVAVFVQKRILYPHIFDGWIGTYSTFWRPIETVLPHWRDHRWAFTYLPNNLILAAVVVIGVIGAVGRLPHRARLSGVAVVAALTVGSLALFAAVGDRPYPDYRWAASVLPGNVGRIENLSRAGREGDGKGLLTFGPYWEVPPGRYEVGVRYDSATDGTVNGLLDVYLPQSDTVLERAELPPTNGEAREIFFPVSVTEQNWGKMEIRTSFEDAGTLVVDWIQLRRIGD